MSARTVRLSPREREVLTLKAQGHSSQAAADALYVSKRTVDFHLLNAYRKLGARNCARAIREAMRLGLIDAEEVGSG